MTELLAARVLAVPDHPQPGIVFRDVTPLLADAGAFRAAIDGLAAAVRAAGWSPQYLLCPEARGFLFGAPLALALGAGFVPVRKPGKLPRATARADYALEYGTDALEVHRDAFVAGSRVLLVDDVLATGGTLAAVHALAGQLGAEVLGALCLIELPALGGRARLAPLPVQALLGCGPAPD